MAAFKQNNSFKALVGLVLGLAAIMYFNPPQTPCTAQIGVYKEGLHTLEKSYGSSLGICKNHPEPGGCIEFFDTLSKIESRFNEVSSQCQVELAHDNPTQSWITQAMEVFTRVAWGSVPPPSYAYRNGWLDLNQVVEFCKLKQHLQSIYGQDAWAGFANDLVTDLPGAKELNTTNPNEAWNRSLLSDPCQYSL